jgi:hypothetical protein
MSHRQLGTSNGCRDHTVLPYASASFVLRAVNRSRCKPPCDHLRTDAVASTASHPAFVTTRDPPLLGDETARAGTPDLPDGESEKFFARGLDRIFAMNADLPVGSICRAEKSLQRPLARRAFGLFAVSMRSRILPSPRLAV